MSLEGQQLGPYRLRQRLGKGGMGEVYLAEDTRIAHRQVAIKVIWTEINQSSDAEATRKATDLFQREVMAITRLNHPYILPLFDVGEAIINGFPLTYMVMPFCQEGSLADWLKRRSQSGLPNLSVQDVAHILSQAAAALQNAHDQQIVHRDVKPQNFLIRSNTENLSRPDLMLADFGIAKLTLATARTSHIRGTPTYMAPEQWTGYAVPATDQYALAVMAYELLTGRPPFQGTQVQLLNQHLHDRPRPSSTLNPLIPPAIDVVLQRALAKQPEDRFPSVSAFVRAFQQAILEASSIPTSHPPIAYSATGTQITGPNAPTMRGTASTGNIPNPQRSMNATIPPPPPPQFSNPGFTPSTTSPPSSISSLLSSPRWRTILVIGLVLLILLASIGIYFGVNQVSTNNAHVAATAQANTATAQVVNATATVVAANPNPYLPSGQGGTLALYDPLSKNSNINWLTNGACSFKGDGYHASETQEINKQFCFAQATNFSNFTYEVDMRILNGYAGGLIFRADDATNTFYYFHMCINGCYALYLMHNNEVQQTLTTDSTSNFRTGKNASNQLAVVVQGSQIDLYVDGQHLAKVNDSSSNHGHIGVVAETSLLEGPLGYGPTDVAYTNARVWTL